MKKDELIEKYMGDDCTPPQNLFAASNCENDPAIVLFMNSARLENVLWLCTKM